MRTNTLELYVKPNAKKTGIEGFYGDRIKIRIASPPERGKANRELIDLISKITGITKSKIRIISGITSNYKMVLIEEDTGQDYVSVILGNNRD